MTQDSRRNFFRSMVGRLSVFGDEVKGHQHLSLNSLHTLPDEIIDTIVPVLFDDGIWLFDNDRLLKRDEKSGELALYRELSQQEATIAGHFGRGLSLAAIAEVVRETIDLEDARSATNKLFFKCARLRICHPAEPVELEER
jgi:hypothetical protein